MITQNPIIGRARKKLSGVYSCTLYGKNILRTCPGPSNKPPTAAQRSARSAFALVNQMANMVPKSILYNIYYAAPIGRNRRQFITSQLLAGCHREEGETIFDLTAITALGSNTPSTRAGLLYTIPAKVFSVPVSAFSATTAADTTKIPCVMAISYEKGVCLPLLSYTTLSEGVLLFNNISDTIVGAEVLLLALWQVNVGTSGVPVYAFGSFQANTQ